MIRNRGLLRSQWTREARLQRVRSAQEQRIAAESMDETEARLQRVRSTQEQRIAHRAVKAEPVVQKNITSHILLIFSLHCCNV